MNTKLQTMVFENESVVEHGFNRTLNGEAHKVVATLSGDNTLNAVNDAEMRLARGKSSAVRTIAMFIASPFIALAYIVALPFIGFYQIAKLALEAYSRKHPSAARKIAKVALFAKNVGLFLISPFIALAYVFALPFVGFYMFTKLVLEAQAKRQIPA